MGAGRATEALHTGGSHAPLNHPLQGGEGWGEIPYPSPPLPLEGNNDTLEGERQ